MKDYTYSDDWVTYVPEFDENRFDEDPVTVEIKPLTVREARQFSKGIVAKRVKGGGFKTNAVENNLNIIRTHARNITNLTVQGKQITTIEELETTPLSELLGEIEVAITEISVLNEGDIKNLKSQSGGVPEKTHGTAQNALESNN